MEMLHDSEKWGRLNSRFNTKASKLHPSSADNMIVAWPVIFSLMEKYGTGMKSNVLDFGCGTGGFCNALHSRGFSVSGIDYSEAMVRLARKNSPPGINYGLGNQAAIGSLGKKFDLIVSIMVLQFIDDIKSVADAFRASLTGRGLVIIATVNPDFVKLCSEKDVRYGNYSGKSALMTFSPDVSFNIFPRSQAEYETIFRQCGFEFLEIQKPVFPDGFAEKYRWALPTEIPEFLIMTFRKKKK